VHPCFPISSPPPHLHLTTTHQLRVHADFSRLEVAATLSLVTCCSCFRFFAECTLLLQLVMFEGNRHSCCSFRRPCLTRRRKCFIIIIIIIVTIGTHDSDNCQCQIEFNSIKRLHVFSDKWGQLEGFPKNPPNLPIGRNSKMQYKLSIREFPNSGSVSTLSMFVRSSVAVRQPENLFYTYKK